MRKKMKHIFAWLSVLVLAVGCTAPTADEWPDANRVSVQADSTLHRYRLNMAVGFADGQADTRAAYQWADGDSLFLLFQAAEARIVGVARYLKSYGEWEVTTRGRLPDAEEAPCGVAFFRGAKAASATTVNMDSHTCAYTDEAAVWSLDDGIITVTGSLRPLTGRVRFRGQPGQQFTLSGLAFMTTFSPATFAFASQPLKFTATVGSDGYSPYYYATFANADSRRLVFELTTTTGLARSFGPSVLQPGRSGSIAIPTADSHSGWTLVNLTTDGEITLPAVSAVMTVSVRSKQATLTATVTSVGGGRLQAAGFVLATTHDPTLANTTLACGTATSLTATVTGLLPETTYYVRAFAQNEAGITYGEELRFSTTADNSTIGRDDFEADENWNDVTGTHGNIGNFSFDTFGDDENWNDVTGTQGNISNFFFDTFRDDENWNDVNGTEKGDIVFDAFGDDEDWNY